MFKTMYQVRRPDESLAADQTPSLLEAESDMKAVTALGQPARIVSVSTIISNKPWRDLEPMEAGNRHGKIDD